MVLSNAEKQRRWRDRRNRLAEQASTVSGLINLLARAMKGKTDWEVEAVANRVWDRLMQRRKRKG